MNIIENIILISGEAQHGKDSIASILQETLGNTLIIPFASYLKYLCKEYFGWDGVKDEQGRTILQYWGTDVIRQKNPNMWVNVVSETCYSLEDEIDYFIMPDCRFPNEYTVMQDIFGDKVISLKVERTNFDNGLTQEQKNHSSEIAMKDFIFDYIIYNDGSLEELEEKVDRFIQDYLFNV